MIGKNLRFLSRYYGQLVLLLLVFWALVLLGLATTRDMDGVFGTYYRMFPVLVGIIAGVSRVSGGVYQNTALGMNGGRRALFWANQVMLCGLTLLSALLSVLLWWLGGRLVPGEETATLWLILPMSAGALLAGQGGSLLSHARGVLLRAASVLYTLALMALCGSITVATLLFFREEGAVPGALFCGLVTAGLLAAALVLGAVEYRACRRAVVL